VFTPAGSRPAGPAAVAAVLVALLLLGVALWGAWQVLLFADGIAIDEGAVPPRSEIPALPPGVTLVRQDVSCGSGGCWHDLRLRPPAGLLPQQVVAQAGWSPERCHQAGTFLRRRVCVGAQVVGDEVDLYVGYS
jgi:hypothetical protein